MGRKSRERRKENETVILTCLLSEPLTITELVNKTKLSRITLWRHLKSLEERKIIKPVVKNRRIAYTVVNKQKSIVELRKGFLNEFQRLLLLYGYYLSKETLELTEKYLDFIEESIKHPFGLITKPSSLSDKIFPASIKFEMLKKRIEGEG
jgi:DNA-binding MarR family transcriptional regulator